MELWAKNNINLGDCLTNFFEETCILKDRIKQYRSHKVKLTGSRYMNDVIIYGLGFYNHIEDLNLDNIKLVRGKLTLNIISKFINKEINLPTCDPGVILSDIIQPKATKKKFKIGIVPHWWDNYYNIDIIKSCLSNDITYIEIDGKYDFQNFVDKINECEIILTSSLHGSVFSHSYNIPTYYISFEPNNRCHRNRDLKFQDYFTNYSCDFLKLNFFNLININMIDYINKLYYKMYNPSKSEIINLKKIFWKNFPYKDDLLDVFKKLGEK